jgi:hypothetical protein
LIKFKSVLLAAAFGVAGCAAWAQGSRPVLPLLPREAILAGERPGPVKPWFPGLDPVPGMPEPFRRVAQRLAQAPESSLDAYNRMMLDDWRKDQSIAQVTASLPWSFGPVELFLGGAVRCALPAGFKFVDAAGVATFCRALDRPIPGPASFATRLGKVMTEDQSCLGELVLLKAGHTDDRQALPTGPLASDSWLLAPEVDTGRHTLTWARTVDPNSEAGDLFTWVLFGKDCCLLIEFPFPPNDCSVAEFRARLQPLLDGMTFLPRQAYSQHKGSSGKLTLGFLLRNTLASLDRDPRAMGKFLGTESLGSYFSDLPWAGSLMILLTILLGLLGYRSWRRGRKTGSDEAVTEAMVAMLDLRVAQDQVEARIRGRVLTTARQVWPAAAFFTAIIAVAFGFVAFTLGGFRAALILVACILVLIPLGAWLGWRNAGARIAARWRALPWDRGVSFICPTHGLVLLSKKCLALEWYPNPGGGGTIWKSKWLRKVNYDRAGHALVIETVKVYGPHSFSWQEHYTLRLPDSVAQGQAEAIADVFHMLWAGEQRLPTPAAKSWLSR